VVAGRTESREKVYDVPERALGDPGVAIGDFARWALLERVEAAGLLTRASGAMWSMLSSVRTSSLVDDLINEGALVEVQLEDSARRYLAKPSFLKQRRAQYDDRIRILGPLDPLLWDRDLVRHAFEFDYVWEVYKPERQRRWGWYVCPLLQRDRLIGRIDARIERGTLIVRKIWMEDGFEDVDVAATLERHALLCGAKKVRMPRRR
ncbi:MAG TPA: crosslink repair DNA glycosylase YcaQ family protein, partial [Thermoanaerobaculia bacterium]